MTSMSRAAAAFTLGLCTLLFTAATFAQALRAPDAEQFVGPPQGTPVGPNDIDRKTSEIAAELRCPVCQGLAIGDSPSAMALNMKEQVRELLGRGFTEAQILKYFELSYGQFVLLRPKFQGVNSLVWLLPLIVLAFGAMLVFVKVRSLQQPVVDVAEVPAVVAGASTDSNDRYQDPYIERARALARGDE